MAQVALTGRLSQDVTVRFTPSGQPVASFNLAESIYVGKGKAKDGKDYGTEWWSVTVWGPQAANLNDRIGKGDSVTIFGQTQSREYQDKNGEWKVSNGSKVTAERVVAHTKREAKEEVEETDDLAELLK